MSAIEMKGKNDKFPSQIITLATRLECERTRLRDLFLGKLYLRKGGLKLVKKINFVLEAYTEGTLSKEVVRPIAAHKRTDCLGGYQYELEENQRWKKS